MNPSQPVDLPFENSHAFIIGIDQYIHLSPLHTAVNDAKALAAHLQERHGFTVHEPLINADKAALEKLLNKDIPAMVGENDRVFLYFAGHGIALDSQKGFDGFLLPADAKEETVDSLLPVADLVKAMDALPCKHGMVILDACFSGDVKWAPGSADMLLDLPRVIYRQMLIQYQTNPAWQMIATSCEGNQVSDTFHLHGLGVRDQEGMLNSEFALALLEGLAGEADLFPTEKGNSIITGTELFSYLEDRLKIENPGTPSRIKPYLFALPSHNKGQYIFIHPEASSLSLPIAPNRNPYLGLRSFDEADSSLFYGRKRVVEALEEKIVESQLVVVSGPSGSGKSSVIKAGLLPSLRKKGAKIHPVIRPGKHPLQSLEDHIPNLRNPVSSKEAHVLVIDQYEELVTQCLDQDEREGFERQLAFWLREFPNLLVVISIRSELEKMFAFRALEPWWQKGKYIVPAFTREELREIIVRPAHQEMLHFEPFAWVEELLNEIISQQISLPSVSFTLSELYKAYLRSKRTDQTLTKVDYIRSGGMADSLRKTFEGIYTPLSDRGKDAMKRLMARMTTQVAGEVSGRKVYWPELYFSDKEETDAIREVAEKMVKADLLIRGQDAKGRVYIEPAHNMMIGSWPLFWEWIHQEGEDKLIWQNALAKAVNDFQQAKIHDPRKVTQALWNNQPRLDLVSSGLEELNSEEERFVRQSMKLKKRRTRMLQMTGGALIIALTGLTAFVLWKSGKGILPQKEGTQSPEFSNIAPAPDSLAILKERVGVLENQLTLAKEMISSQPMEDAAPPPAIIGKGEITGVSVNLRESYSLNSSVITRLTRQRVDVIEKYTPRDGSLPWYKISNGTDTGWMRGDFIKIDE